MTISDDPVEIALLVARALDACHVEYFLTGSVASGILGQPRFTRDIDFVVHLRARQVEAFAAALGSDFDVDADSLKDAANRHGSWNIFHLPTMARVDLFVVKEHEYDVEALFRRRSIRVGEGQSLSVVAPEDAILTKLRWFKEGAEVDSKQLQDVVDVLRVQQGRLDQQYLERWSQSLGLAELLARAAKLATG